MQRVYSSTAHGRSTVSRRTSAVRCRCQHSSPAQKQVVADASVELLTKRVSAALAGVALSAALVAGPSLPAQAYFGYETPEQIAEEKDTIAREEQMLEYILQQQSIARQAQIAAERQTLQVELSKAQETLEKKLTEEQVNLDAVIAKGDTKAAQVIGAEQNAIAEREQQLVQAAAIAEAKIDREEMIAKAAKVAAHQALEKEVTAATAVVDALVPAPAESAAVAETAPEVPAPVVVAETTPEAPAPVVVAETSPEAPAPVVVAEVVPEAPVPVSVAEVVTPPAVTPVVVAKAPVSAPAASSTDAESVNKAIDAFLSSF